MLTLWCFLFPIVKSCTCPSPPTYGTISCNESHLAGTGSRVTYYCNGGYTLSGSSYRTCQNSGNWTGTDPTCVKRKLSIIVNLIITCSELDG